MTPSPQLEPFRRDVWARFEAQRDEMEAASAPDTPRSRAPRENPAPVSIEALDEVPYVELHLHSNYSLLEGASHVDELTWAAHQQGHRALALSDHNGM